jgi:sorbitol-6-phosphate 2-dehydrogenase
MSWLGLEGKAVLITGGASGIGRACAEGFADSGARIMLGDVDRVAGEETAAALSRRYRTDVLFKQADVGKAADAEGLVAAAVERLGRLDALVNNAGVNVPRLLADPARRQELTEEVWDRMMSINLKGVFLCAQEAARAMTRNGSSGVIINMASESGLEGSEGQSAYAATKAALYGLTRSWAKELGRRGVRVVGVAPGILEATGLRSETYEADLAYARGTTVAELRRGYVSSAIPLGRAGRLSEVADLVCFLASDRASYIHGTVVNISGGKSRE